MLLIRFALWGWGSGQTGTVPFVGPIVTVVARHKLVRTPYMPCAFYKRPGQAWLIGVDCVNILPALAAPTMPAFAAVNATMNDSAAPDVLSAAPSPIIGSTVYCILSGGTVHHTYRIDATITCNDDLPTVLTEQFTMTILPEGS